MDGQGFDLVQWNLSIRTKQGWDIACMLLLLYCRSDWSWPLPWCAIQDRKLCYTIRTIVLRTQYYPNRVSLSFQFTMNKIRVNLSLLAQQLLGALWYCFLQPIGWQFKQFEEALHPGSFSSHLRLSRIDCCRDSRYRVFKLYPQLTRSTWYAWLLNSQDLIDVSLDCFFALDILFSFVTAYEYQVSSLIQEKFKKEYLFANIRLDLPVLWKQ